MAFVVKSSIFGEVAYVFASVQLYLWAVKLWRIILALYVLVLSGVPCEAYCCGEQVTVTHQVPASDSPRQQHEEGCSPFCICAVCAGFAMPQTQRLLQVSHSSAPVVMVAPPLYRIPYWLDVPGSIWQPPRLG